MSPEPLGPAALAVAAVLTLGLGEGIARMPGTRPALLATGGVLAAALVGALALAGAGRLEPLVEVAPVLVVLMGAATVLARPPSWREPPELGRLAETTLLVALSFATRDLVVVSLLWIAALLPGLRFREQPGVSRRPFGIKAFLAALSVAVALLVPFVPALPHPDRVAFAALVLGAAVRMGVPPFSPLVLSGYERLPFGRHALVAAARPSVALLLAARLAFPYAVEPLAPTLQGWAAVAAALAGLQGLAAETPRRSVGAMATTQASIILYGLVSPGESGVLGALVQWAGLGLSMVGLGLLVEAIESRVGQQRASRTRGLIAPAPGMALLFLLFAATMSGFPGTTGFVGEDLIMQAPTRHEVVWRTLLLAATALNGFTMLRVFAHTFLGPLWPSEIVGFPSLNLRERLVLGMIAVAIGVLVASPGVVGPA